MEAFREIFWNISIGPWILYPLALVVTLIFVYAIVARFWLIWRRGKPENRFHPFWRRIGDFIKVGIVEGLANKRILRELYPGIPHLLIVWG